MTVKFLDLLEPYQELKQEIDNAISRVLNSGWYILGEEVDAFEAAWANYCGTEYALGVANGLDALILGLLALGVGPGDEVIVPSNTYIATWLAVSHVGAKIVPVDPFVDTYNIDVTLIEEKITEKTKVIIPVHLYGQACDLDPILLLAKKYNLYILEDAAQAHGAKYKGKTIGGHGDIVAWSFYPGKNLGALGDGGAITTNSQTLYEKIKLLRNYGSTVKYVNEVKGLNSRLDPLQAAVLMEKLKVLDSWNSRRQEIANFYFENLNQEIMTLPFVSGWTYPVWHLFVIKTKKRQEIQNILAKNDIQTMIHYPIPPHLQNAYANLGYQKGDYPRAEFLANEVLSLPMGPHLKITDLGKIFDIISKIGK